MSSYFPLKTQEKVLKTYSGFIEQILNAVYMPGTALGIGHSRMNKQVKAHKSKEIMIQKL